MSALRKAGGQSYQRLEFLGDRVLGLAIAELLYRTFPGAPEGELSRRLAELVRRESCAEIATAWDVGPYLKLGAGEAHSGERRNQTILADVCEAIIGAVFLDGGYEAARELVERAFQELLEAPAPPAARPEERACRNGRKGRGLPPPTYSVVEQTGPDHAPKFRVMVKVKGAESEFGSARRSGSRNRRRREAFSCERASGRRKSMAQPEADQHEGRLRRPHRRARMRASRRC